MKNRKQVKQAMLAAACLYAVPIIFVVCIAAHVIATVQTCGWRGLFVECRITEVK